MIILKGNLWKSNPVNYVKHGLIINYYSYTFIIQPAISGLGVDIDFSIVQNDSPSEDNGSA